MSLLSAAATRLLTTAVYLTRVAAHRLGAGPFALVATATVAAIYIWRHRRLPPPPAPPTPHASAPAARAATPASATATTNRSPAFLARVRRVTLGATWSDAHRCDLFCSVEGGGVGVKKELVEAVRAFASAFDLYIVVHVDGDDGERAVREAVENAGVFDAGLDRRKLLFCETELGKVSIARQIEAQMHVDESVAVVRALHRFVPYVALVTKGAEGVVLPPAANVLRFTSLAAFKV